MKRSSKNGSGMTGEELKQLRLSRQLSRPRLAALAGVHSDTVRYWERKGRIDLNGYAPPRLLNALGADLPRQERGDIPTPTRVRHGLLLRQQTSKQKTGCCGAQTRQGTPCQAKSLPGKSRCKFHGGLSTGPKTLEGKARIAEVQRRRWRLQRD